jgi:hypothetical protein
MQQRGFLVAILILILTAVSISAAHAQTFPGLPSGGANIQSQFQQLQQLQQMANQPGLVMDQYPENPGPRELIDFTLTGSAGIETATITWQVNGATKSTGVGQTRFRTAAPESGQSVTVIASARWRDGRSATVRKVIRPVAVTILWQTNSYTPPFYRGKALNAYQAPVTFVAMTTLTGANGARIPASNLLYTWKRDGETLGSQSGYGKNTITLSGSVILKPFDLELTVSTVDKTVSGSQRIRLTAIEPQLVLYLNNPLVGVEYERALPSSVRLANNEVTFYAAPYFFNVAPGETMPVDWSVNGAPVFTGNPRELTVRQEQEGGGRSVVKARIENPTTLLQFDETSISIQLQDQLRTTGF